MERVTLTVFGYVGSQLISENKRMPEEKLIDQIRTVVREEIATAEKRIVETVTKKIDESQADTIQVLSDLINSSHTHNDERISHIEKVLHISKN